MAVDLEIIYARVKRVPKGFVTTYGDLSPGSPRHAGRAMSKSGGDDLPWWRVVRSDGSWSQGEKQRRLLEDEDIPIRGRRVMLDEARIAPEAIY